MKFLGELVLVESELASRKEANYVISVVNKIYSEWKKTGRRKNAVDIITTTANKLSNIDPSILPRIHEATKLKLATLIIRCFDIPYWKGVSERKRIYDKLYRLISALHSYDPKTDTGGDVKSIICTRLSASVCYNSDRKEIFVAYEPKMPDSYLRYIFGKEKPVRTYRMRTLMLPADYESLIETLKINHRKAVAKYDSEKETVAD